MSAIHVPPPWRELVEEVYEDRGPVIVLGAPDTGKTTLAYFLAKELREKANETALVSVDMGQCAFGPPATIGMTILERVPRSLAELTVETMYFIGSTSPIGHLLQTVVGVKKLVEKAYQRGAEVIVIDTDGLVEGGAALELKFQEIEITNAKHLVALQREKELENMLLPHVERTRRKIHRLEVFEGTKVKSHGERREYRRRRFMQYFEEARLEALPLRSLMLISPLQPVLEKAPEGIYRRLLVGLNDDENFSLGLGLIEDIDPKKGRLTLLTPLQDLEAVKIIRLGSLILDENWYESRARLPL